MQGSLAVEGDLMSTRSQPPFRGRAAAVFRPFPPIQDAEGIAIGQSGVFLNLTEEQYGRLKRRVDDVVDFGDMGARSR